MDLTAVITSLLTLLAGIGVFLTACQMMSSNLEAASSERLKKLFSKASGSKFLGVGIVALGTAAIQSSGATTVMTIGFVNAGIISLVDRLCHKAYLVNMSGPSYRILETKKLNEK